MEVGARGSAHVWLSLFTYRLVDYKVLLEVLQVTIVIVNVRLVLCQPRRLQKSGIRIIVSNKTEEVRALSDSIDSYLQSQPVFSQPILIADMYVSSVIPPRLAVGRRPIKILILRRLKFVAFHQHALSVASMF